MSVSTPPRRLPRWTFALAATLLSCAPEFDTARRPNARGTLGEEVFGVVCERTHYGESPADVTFERGRRPCTQGLGATESAPVGPKTLALGRMRRDVAASLDRAMPSALETPLDQLLVNLLPLYGPDGSGRRASPSGPFLIDDPAGRAVPSEPVLPETTRAVVSFLDGVRTDVEFLRAMGRASLRQGTRPADVSIGLLRPLLADPQLDATLDQLLRLVREATPTQPRGSARPQLDALFEVMRGEFASAGPSTETRGGTTLDATIDLMLRTEAGLARSTPVEVARRDSRGVASVDLSNSQAAALFADRNGDGAADVDREGFYLGPGGRIDDAPTPYPAYGRATVQRDARGRAVTANGLRIFRHVDLDASVLGALARELPGLLGAPGHESPPAIDLLRGAIPLLGPRRVSTREYTPAVTVRYGGFSAENSAIVDLAHAAGQLFGHRDADAVLRLTAALMAPEREALTARLVGAMLRVDEISDQHPEATMAAEAPLWDEVVEVVRRIAQEPGLLEDILQAVVQLQQPIPATGAWDARCAGTLPAENLARAYASYARNRDRVEPDWRGDWNRLPERALGTPVNRALPDTVDLATPGSARDNRSVLQRLFHLIDDLAGARMCNKPRAAVRVRFNVPILGEQSLTVPGAGDINQCQLVEVPDAAAFFSRSIVGDGRAILPMDLPGLTGSLANVARQIGLPVDSTLDRIIESQTGITGFNSRPTPYAIARLVFHPQPNAFLRDLMDPPAVRNVLPTPASLPPSPTPEDRAVRSQHPGTLFVWESGCFYDSMRPLLAAFAKHDRHMDGTRDPRWTPGRPLSYMAPRNLDLSRGTQLFAQLIGAFHRNWATAAATDYQSAESCETCPSGQRFSRRSGASRYEPIFAGALDAGLLQTLGAVTADLRTIDVGNGRNGVDALATLVRALVDPSARAMDGSPAFAQPLSYRDGRRSTRWSDDRTAVPQVGLYYLFADAFNSMDAPHRADPAAHARWERARSALVDQLIAVNGAGESARFRNRSLAPLTRALVAWLRDRVAAHRAAGDLDAWSRSLGPRLATTVQGAPFAAATDLLVALDDDAAARVATLSLLTRTLDETAGAAGAPSNFAVTVTAAADLLQVMRADAEVDPILRPLAPVFTPSTGLAARGLRFLDRARERDPARVLTSVLGNMVRAPAGQREPLMVLADAVADTHRERPGQHGALGPMDVHLVLTALSEFFGDTSRGMEQFYAIVQRRRLP
ncbi:MAG: hypothetical protein R3A48_17215 [Polyangiales bacterium]